MKCRVAAALCVCLFLITTLHAAAQNSSAHVTCSGSLLFMGDTMLARSVGANIVAGDNPYKYMQSILDAAALRIANIETVIAHPLTGKRASGKLYAFNAPVAAIPVLKKAKIDLAILANNHTMDFGSAALKDMLKIFADAGIATVGAGLSTQEAFEPRSISLPLRGEYVNNNYSHSVAVSIAVAFIAVNDVETLYANAGDTRAGAAYFDREKIKTAIAKARAQGAAIVIILPHWGSEFTTEPTAQQRTWGHFFIDAGADAVIGCHPHVIQPTELYKGKPIVYSLGNFIFDGMADLAIRGPDAARYPATRGQIAIVPIFQSCAVDGGATLGTLARPVVSALGAPLVGDVKKIFYTINSDGYPQPDFFHSK